MVINRVSFTPVASKPLILDCASNDVLSVEFSVVFLKKPNPRPGFFISRDFAHRGLQFSANLADTERVRLTLELSEIQLTAAPVEDWETAISRYLSLAEQALDHGDLAHARQGYHLASYLRWVHGQWSEAQRYTLQAERVTRGGKEEDHILGMAETAKCLALLERELSQADAMLMEARTLG